MLIDIYMKCLEDILNRFQFTDFVMDKVPREITQKSINTRVMVLALCTLSNVHWIFI